jgi:membrane protease subunit HflC
MEKTARLLQSERAFMLDTSLPTLDHESMTSDLPKTRSFTRRRFLAVLGLLLASAVALTSVLFVDETELVIVERLGSLSAVYDNDSDRGLHFKWPWPIETARRFDRRVQLLDLPARELLTRDKKNITVDAYVSWRIVDAEPGGEAGERPIVRFFRAMGDEKTASARLESRVNSVLTARFGQVEFDRLLEVEDSETAPSKGASGMLGQLAEEIRRDVQSRSLSDEDLGDQLGIEIVEVGFERLNFPEGNRAAVYERMRSERRKIADRYRAEGLAESQVLRSQAELWAESLLARANADAERIKGEAEAEAARVLNAAHLQDPEFYRVLRTLDGYRRIIHPETTLVLSASSELLKLLTEGLPKAEEPQPQTNP